MKFSIVIPCYNYENLILKKFTKLKKFLNNKRYSYEIIIVNDGSQDNTLKKIIEISKFDKDQIEAPYPVLVGYLGYPMIKYMEKINLILLDLVFLIKQT